MNQHENSSKFCSIFECILCLLNMSSKKLRMKSIDPLFVSTEATVTYIYA